MAPITAPPNTHIECLNLREDASLQEHFRFADGPLVVCNHNLHTVSLQQSGHFNLGVKWNRTARCQRVCKTSARHT